MATTDKNPSGERRCAVGVDHKGEPIFELFVRRGWAMAEIQKYKTALEVAEKMAEKMLKDQFKA